MKKCLTMFFVIIMIICLPIVCKAATCNDIIKDDYEISSDIGALPFNGKLADNLNPSTGNFMNMYDFLTRGVNIEKLNDKGKKIYRDCLQKTLDYMADTEASYVVNGQTFNVKESIEKAYNTTIEKERDNTKKLIKDAGGTQQQTQTSDDRYDDVTQIDSVSNSTSTQERVDTATNSIKDNHREPKKRYTFDTADRDKQGVESKSLGEIIQDAKNIENGDSDMVFKEGDIKPIADFLYNALLAIGIAVTVIIGGIIGIKLMTGSAEQKAETKQYIVPYIVGCVVIFGGLGIWKIVINILQSTKI